MLGAPVETLKTKYSDKPSWVFTRLSVPGSPNPTKNEKNVDFGSSDYAEVCRERWYNMAKGYERDSSHRTTFRKAAVSLASKVKDMGGLALQVTPVGFRSSPRWQRDSREYPDEGVFYDKLSLLALADATKTSFLMAPPGPTRTRGYAIPSQWTSR